VSPEDRERLWTEEVDIAASRNEVVLAAGDRQGERDNSGKTKKGQERRQEGTRGNKSGQEGQHGRSKN